MDWLSRELIAQQVDLREEHQLLEKLISTLEGGVAYVGRDLNYKLVNPVFAGYSGLEPLDFIGRRMNTVVPELTNDIERLTKKALESAQPMNVRRLPLTHLVGGEKQHMYIDGSVSPVVGDDGSFTGVLWLCLDVTDSVMLERERNRLASIVESSFDGIISCTREGVITSWNEGAQRIFGYSAHEAVGQSLAIIVPSDFQEQHVALLAGAHRGERLPFATLERLHKSGRRIKVGITISPLRDQTQEVIGASAVVRDLTEDILERHSSGR